MNLKEIQCRQCCLPAVHFHLINIVPGETSLIAVCSNHRSGYISDQDMLRLNIPILTREEAECWLVHQA